MSIIIPHYAIDVLKETMHLSEKLLLSENLFEDNVEVWIGKANTYHLLQLIVNGKMTKVSL